MRNLLTVITLTIAATILWSCSDDSSDNDEIYTNYRYDIVTFNGQQNGGNAVFNYVPRSSDSAQVSIVAQNSIDVSNLHAGQRVLLRYTPLNGNSLSSPSTQAKIHFYNSIISDSLRAYKNNIPVDSFIMHPVQLQSIWRTGDYINIHCKVPYTGKARQFMLVLDKATASSDTVNCYLIHNMLTDSTYFWRNCYASFHVGKVFNRTSCRTLSLHINNSANSSANTFFFSK